MFKFLGKQTPKRVVEEAKSIKVDKERLQERTSAFIQDGPSYTVITSGGKRTVYSGDLSTQGPKVAPQGPPLLVFEYKSSHHAAAVKNGDTGEVLMMLVREPDEEQWHDPSKGTYVAIGGNTQGRLYLNGSPVGVNYSKQLMDVAPRVSVGERAELGATLVECVKVKKGNSVSLHKRKGNGSVGAEVAAFTKLKGGISVFNLIDPEVVDPIVAITMLWYNTIDEE